MLFHPMALVHGRYFIGLFSVVRLKCLSESNLVLFLCLTEVLFFMDYIHKITVSLVLLYGYQPYQIMLDFVCPLSVGNHKIVFRHTNSTIQLYIYYSTIIQLYTTILFIMQSCTVFFDLRFCYGLWSKEILLILRSEIV